MAIISFLFQLLGAVFLLLYAVRMVRTGIERAFGRSFRRAFTNSGGRIRSVFTGLCLAIVLQSSAAVTLLATGFAAAGLVALPVGLAIVLGADMGSALLIQLLSHRVDWLVPVLLTIGAGLFIKTERRGLRQAGRIILGIAFILISLQFLRETMDPIREANFLPALATYLERDAVTAFLAGAALAWLMHSSVAVILMCVTLVSVGAFPVTVGVSLVLGANLGSAMVPVWLTRTLPRPERRIAMTILVLRGGWAVVALALVGALPMPLETRDVHDGQVLILTHIAFNFAMLVFLPFLGWITGRAVSAMPDDPSGTLAEEADHRSVLDPTLFGRPKLALACLRREVLRMLEMSANMFSQVQTIYATGDRTHGKAIIQQDRHMNRALDGVRRYAAEIDVSALDDTDVASLRELVEYAVALESAADVVIKRLVPRGLQKMADGMELSPEGAAELARLHDRVRANLPLASAVLLNEGTEGARLLLEEKETVNRQERQSRQRHLERLNAGSAQTFGSSNLHLETLRALKDFNSLIASVAYPILQRTGQLRDSRLIEFPQGQMWEQTDQA